MAKSIAASVTSASVPNAPFINLPAVATLLLNFERVALAASSPCAAFFVNSLIALSYYLASLQSIPFERLHFNSGTSLFIKAASPLTLVTSASL